MRISELSRNSGVPVPTLKFYLREGLLPPGTSTAPKQAEYSETHLRRLRLIRTLTRVGGLSLRAVRRVVDAIDDERVPLHDLLGVAHHALALEADEADLPGLPEAGRAVDALIADLGWHVDPGAPARTSLARTLAMLRETGFELDARMFHPYAAAVEPLAQFEVASVPSAESRARAVEWAVIGTVAFEAALVALRRLALEHHSSLRFRGSQRHPGT